MRLNEHWKTRNLEKLKFLFLGRGDLWWMGWGMRGVRGEVCKVRYAGWGMQGGVREVRFTRGESYLVKFFTP